MSQLVIHDVSASHLVPLKETTTVSPLTETLKTPVTKVVDFATRKCSDLFSYLLGLPKNALVDYTSPLLPYHWLRKTFFCWDSEAGQTLLKIKTVLQQHKILPEMSLEEFKSDLEARLYYESANTGEAFAQLIHMTGLNIDIKKSIIPLTLLQKIETMILERQDDIALISKSANLQYEIERQKLISGFYEELENFKKIKNDTDTSKLEKLGNSVIKNIVAKTEKIKEENEKINTYIDTCDEATVVLCKFETSLFQNKNITFVEKKVVKNISDAQKIAALLAGTTDTLFIRAISVNKKHIAQDVFSANIDPDKCLYFAPRIGTARLSKTDSKDVLEKFFMDSLKSNNSVQLTIWKKATPTKVDIKPVQLKEIK